MRPVGGYEGLSRFNRAGGALDKILKRQIARDRRHLCQGVNKLWHIFDAAFDGGRGLRHPIIGCLEPLNRLRGIDRGHDHANICHGRIEVGQ